MLRWLTLGIVVLATAACSTASSTPARSSAPGVVDAKGFAFSPSRLTVTQGTTLRYVNGDRAEHTITQGSNGVADAGAAFDAMLAIEGSTSVTFSTPGEIHVTCKLHPTMNQTVIVT